MTNIKNLEKQKILETITSTKTDLVDLRKAYLTSKGYVPTKKGWLNWANDISGYNETNLQMALYKAYLTLSTRTAFNDVKYDFLVGNGLVINLYLMDEEGSFILDEDGNKILA